MKSGYGAGRVRLSDCLNAGDALFYAQLAELHAASLPGGTETARAAMPLVERIQWLPLDCAKRAWVSSAHANVLLSAGALTESADASARSYADWQAAGRSGRAAAALMARGENASRSGRLDLPHCTMGRRERLLAVTPHLKAEPQRLRWSSCG